MRRVPDQEHAPDPKRGRHHRFDGPARDLVDIERDITDAQRLARVGFDLRIGLGSRIVDRIVEVDHPFLGSGTPPLRPHRDHDHQHAGLGREDPADQDLRVLRQSRKVRRHVQGRRIRHHAEALVVHPD